MTRVKHCAGIVFSLLVAISIALHASATDCRRSISATGPPARTVVLAGGDAWTLFRQFLAEIEQRDLDISLWKSKVQISRGGRVETFELGFFKSLSGSAEKHWERNLTGKHAEINPLLLAAAAAARWDIVCAGPITEPGPSAQGQQRKVAAGTRAAPEALVFFKSGVQYASRGDYANALKEFKAAEKIAPDFEGLLMNLGVTYLQLKDYARASHYLQRAIDQNPRNSAAHYNMACLQARLGLIDEAIASLTAAKSNGMTMTHIVKRDPDLTPLRGRRDFEMLFK